MYVCVDAVCVYASSMKPVCMYVCMCECVACVEHMYVCVDVECFFAKYDLSVCMCVCVCIYIYYVCMNVLVCVCT